MSVFAQWNLLEDTPIGKIIGIIAVIAIGIAGTIRLAQAQHGIRFSTGQVFSRYEKYKNKAYKQSLAVKRQSISLDRCHGSALEILAERECCIDALRKYVVLFTDMMQYVCFVADGIVLDHESVIELLADGLRAIDDCMASLNNQYFIQLGGSKVGLSKTELIPLRAVVRRYPRDQAQADLMVQQLNSLIEAWNVPPT